MMHPGVGPEVDAIWLAHLWPSLRIILRQRPGWGKVTTVPGFASTSQLLIAVFLCGGVGAVLRVWLAAAVERQWGGWMADSGILTVNLIGCALAGAASVLWPAGPIKVIVAGGFLGGFTTYGTFALMIADRGRVQDFAGLSIQLGGHVIGGVACAMLGRVIAERLSA